MGEIKSVKVDNWGVFFLQKLQNFFNKTDYCDLTLQFRDNSQLKVHRLVLSACTDYFNVLEQTCEVIDDAIIMPNGLQADVVVPIVNFMYTGTLEFELKMYNRLLRTAKDMNMTVLLKLLEAHRRTMEMHPQKASGQSSPKPRRKTTSVATTAIASSNAGGRSLIQTNQGKRVLVAPNVNASQNRNVSAGNTLTRVPTMGPSTLRQIGATTFTRIKLENETQETSTSPSAGGGYSIIKQSSQQQQKPPTSPFEQLKKGYNNNKRPAVSTFISPPAKKPNLQDVKEFAEQQRMRKQIAAEFGDDDYDASNIMDDDTIHNDDDDDEMMASSGQVQTSQTASAGVQTVASSASQQQQSQDPPGTTTIIVKHEGPDKPPTIIVKDNSNSKMNHAKIISEVLRQYPHLVKGNKNIKLKIMPNAGGQAQKIVVKKDAVETEKQIQQPANKLGNVAKLSESQHQQSVKTLASNIIANRSKNLQQHQSQISQGSKSNNSGTQAASTTSAPSLAGSQQKRRIDSKTMHALIALGAENTTGPWLCLRCGRNGHPISIPSYRGFRRHLINTHKEIIDPALCEHCGWHSTSKRELHFHMQLEHKVKTNLYIFPECQLCQQMCIDSDGLNQHLIDSHPDENKQQCIYCNKIFPEEIQLYTHMKTFHKKQALEDGIIDYSDDENQTHMDLPQLSPIEYDNEMEQEQKEPQQAKKIKILSDICLPIASSIIKTDSFVQQQELNTSAVSGDYLQDEENDQANIETKFVAADGSEVILTAEQRKEILSQLNQEHDGSGIVMVLNENQQQQQQQANSGETQSDHDAISQDENSQATTATNEERQEEDDEEHVADEEDDQHDDNQIYNEMKSLHSNLEDSNGQNEVTAEGTNEENSLHAEEQEQIEHERAEHLDESKESIDNLEWAENLISEHDLADEVSAQTVNENDHVSTLERKEDDVEIKDDDKSQDEISKKLKELTGDWSEDDDDTSEVESVGVISKIEENVKEKEEISMVDAKMAEEDEKGEKIDEKKVAKEQEENREFDDHAELLASLQSTDENTTDKHKTKVEVPVAESENIEEDDIDMALKSLHKEDLDDVVANTAGKQEEDKFSKDNVEENDSKEPIESAKETVLEEAKPSANNDDDKTVSLESTKCTEVKEEKEENLTKEPETTDQTPPSTKEVDEKPKNNLINSPSNEHEEDKSLEDTSSEKLTANETVIKLELETELDKEQNKVENNGKANKESTKEELQINEEFLDITPEKKKEKDSASKVSTIAAASTDSTATTDVVEASTSVKQQTILSSEERVKNLISEWGDDDDEDDNDANLPGDL